MNLRNVTGLMLVLLISTVEAGVLTTEKSESSPLKTGTSAAKKYQKVVDERNDVVRLLAKKYGLKIDDLHLISKNHPEYYRDPFYYKKEAIDLQDKQIAEAIKKTLHKRAVK